MKVGHFEKLRIEKVGIMQKTGSVRKISQKEKPKKTITYSKNIFIPITNLCRKNCDYCGFSDEPENSWFLSKSKVLEIAEMGKKSGCTEALITLGEKPEEEYEVIAKKLNKWGYNTIVEYLKDISQEILKLGMLPHTNAGYLKKTELKKLKESNASLGLMLETTANVEAHDHPNGKKPNKRLETIENAGKLKIPFTTGILVGIGEDSNDREKTLKEIRKLHGKYGHIQEIIVQPFYPKENTPMKEEKPPTFEEILSTIRLAREIFPEMNIQVPPNLVKFDEEMVEAGINDLGGISEVTPDFINPGNSWPDPSKLKKKISNHNVEFKERLAVYPNFLKKRGFLSPPVQKAADNLSDEEGFRE